MNKYSKNSVTISQVAEEAHVSMTTISRYLNGKYEYMSQETKKRISDVIERLDYHPSNIARSLKSQSSKCIGCIIADIGNPFSSILLKGINKVCTDGGYQVIFSDIDDNPKNELESIQRLLDSKVDGLIINTTGDNDDYLIDLSKHGVPIVLADRCLSKKGVIDTVSAENSKITEDCIKHLHENGYTKVAFFTPKIGNISPRIERCDAFLASMKKVYSIDPSNFIFENTGNTEKNYTELLKKFIETNPNEKLAVFCVNGVAMINVLKSLKKLNIKIGENFGICGFDNWEWVTLTEPGITTIAKDSYAIGMKAAEILLNKISSKQTAKEKAPVSLELESKLYIRGSTTGKKE